MARRKYEDTLFGDNSFEISKGFFSDIYDLISIGVLLAGTWYLFAKTDLGDKLRQAFDNANIRLPKINVQDGKITIDSGNNNVGDSGGGSISAGGSWTSSSWSNGKSRSFTSHGARDPYDKVVALHAGSNRRFSVDGKGIAKLQGDQSRIYIFVYNYNGKIVTDCAFTKSGDNLSLRLRSNHQANKGFGGYGCAFHTNGEVSFQRENYHDGGHVNFGSTKVGAFALNKFYNFGFTCQDSGSSVVMKAYVNGKHVATGTDKKPTAAMRSKTTKYYAWIRHNGSGVLILKNASLGNI